MKKQISYITITALSLAFVIACGDEKEFFPDITLAQGARVKFLHAASDASGVNFFVNARKISSGATAGTPTNYSLAFPGTSYALIEPGSAAIKATVPATDVAPEVEIVSATANFESDKHYTVAMIGVTGAFETLVIEDNIASAPIDGKTYIRFLNLIHNSADKLNLVATPPPPQGGGASTPVLLAEDVAYKDVASNFIAITPGAYTNVQLRNAATDEVVATLAAANNTFTANKVYTLVARGQIGAAAPKAPVLDRITNR